MNSDFEKGSILDFGKNTGTFIVLGNIKSQNNLFVLVCPLKTKTNNIIESDLTKMLLFKKESDNELYAETNSEVIKGIIPRILEKENINIS